MTLPAPLAVPSIHYPSPGDKVRRYSGSGVWHSDMSVDSFSNNTLFVSVRVYGGTVDIEPHDEFSLSYEDDSWFWRLPPED